MPRNNPNYQQDEGMLEIQRRFAAYEDASPAPIRSIMDPPSDVSSRHEQRNESGMNSPTREEIDAKLQLIETRMDGRVASIERSVADAIESARETRGDIKSLKWTIIGTAIATVLGIAAFNATVLSNMVASFESGKNTATAQAEVKKQSEETAALIKKMQEDLEARRAQRNKP